MSASLGFHVAASIDLIRQARRNNRTRDFPKNNIFFRGAVTAVSVGTRPERVGWMPPSAYKGAPIRPRLAPAAELHGGASRNTATAVSI